MTIMPPHSIPLQQASHHPTTIYTFRNVKTIPIFLPFTRQEKSKIFTLSRHQNVKIDVLARLFMLLEKDVFLHTYSEFQEALYMNTC